MITRAGPKLSCGTIFILLTSMSLSCSRISFSPARPDAGKDGSLEVGRILINEGDTFTNKTLVNLQIQAKDAHRMYVTNDPSCTAGGVWQDLQDEISGWPLRDKNGVAKVFVKFKNTLTEVQTACISDSIVHDDQAPEVGFDTVPTKITNNTYASLRGAALDKVSGVSDIECSLNSSDVFFDCANLVEIQHPSEGRLFAAVRARDNAGNQSEPLLYEWTVDTIPPSLTLLEKPKVKSNTLPAVFKAVAEDKGTGVDFVQCSLDGGAYTQCNLDIIYGNLQDGFHQFSIQATDKAGNRSSVIGHSWQLDSLAPFLTWVKTPNRFIGPGVNSNFEFRAEDKAGIKETLCSLDRGEFQTCTSPKDYGHLSEGRHDIEVKAVDAFDNLSASLVHSWTVDKQGPIIVFLEAPTEHQDNQPTKFSFQVTDSLSGVSSYRCLVDDSIPVDCEGGKYISGDLPAGSHTLTIEAVDLVGNVSEAKHRWKILKTYDEINYAIDVPSSYNDADILFVVDNSRSMKNEQRNMASRISNFMNQIANLDWRIAVTTTDPNHRINGDGRIVRIHRNNYFLDSNYSLAEAQTLLGQAIQMTDEGSNSEQGIRATFRSLERSLGSNEHEAAFYRREAALSTVLISDEDETGRDYRNNPYNLIEYVRSLWGENKRFSFHSIITRPGDRRCKSEWEHSYGDTYNLLSSLTQGIVGSVCESDYGSQLSAIGEKVKDEARAFTLPCAPVEPETGGGQMVEVILEDGGVAPDYTIVENKIVFESELPVGHHLLKFLCVADQK